MNVFFNKLNFLVINVLAFSLYTAAVKAEKALVVIDMQEKFISQFDPPCWRDDLIEKIIEEINRAKTKNRPILIVEYWDDLYYIHYQKSQMITNTRIMESVAGYPRTYVVKKNKDDGASAIKAMLDKLNLSVDKFSVCGLNTQCCVLETVVSLAKIPGVEKIDILTEACGSTTALRGPGHGFHVEGLCKLAETEKMVLKPSLEQAISSSAKYHISFHQHFQKLFAGLSSDDPEYRKYIARALFNLDEISSPNLGKLLPFLRDENIEVRRLISLIFRKNPLPDPEVRLALFNAIDSQDWLVVKYLAEALSKDQHDEVEVYLPLAQKIYRILAAKWDIFVKSKQDGAKYDLENMEFLSLKALAAFITLLTDDNGSTKEYVLIVLARGLSNDTFTSEAKKIIHEGMTNFLKISTVEKILHERALLILRRSFPSSR